MEKELANNGEILFVRHSSRWLRALPHVFEWNGHKYFVADTAGEMTAQQLPREFYAHQLLDVDPGNVDSLLGFVSRWGFVYDPYRDEDRARWPLRFVDLRSRLAGSVPLGGGAPYAAGNESERIRLLIAYMATNNAMGYEMERTRTGWYVCPEPLETVTACAPEPLRRDINGFTGREFGYWVPPIVSVDEAAAVVERSQQTACAVLSWVGSVLNGDIDPSELRLKDESIFRDVPFSRGVYPAGAGGVGSVCGCFVSAVFDQLQSALLSAEPWKVCANEECNRPFKQKQNFQDGRRESWKRSGKDKYCCEQCRNAQGNRNKRASALKRVKH